ncbi:hypothetical protein ACFQH6_08250 [Halobacteriaceae archaeon GCM10025711]
MADSNVSRSDWKRQPDDPNPERDLGYEMVDWDVVRARKNGSEHLMFLPADEEMIRGEAFIVVHPDDVVDLEMNL